MVETIRCPDCGRNHVIKKGKRKMKYRTLQIYYCKICRKRFVRKELKDKTYPPNVVVSAINYYNQGYTLEETSKLVNRRFKVKVSMSSLHNWLTEFSNVCSFGKIRNEMLKNFKKGEVVFTNSFEHRGLDYGLFFK